MRGPVGLRVTVAILFLAGFCGMMLEARKQNLPAQKEITYTKDVAPILTKNCVSCHRPNDIGPMPLMNYDQVLPFARMIRESVVQRKMPPWHADPSVGEFMNDARLSSVEIATINGWVQSGMKQDNAHDLPP